MIRILIVDDHPVVREGLQAVLEDQPGFEVAGTAGTAEDALGLLERLTPDVVLLDLELPGMGGMAAIPGIAARSRVVVFTAYSSDEQVFGALRAGARGYLLKGAPAEEIARAIRVVYAGGSHLEPGVAARLVAELGAPSDPPLSDREREVLRLVVEGLSSKQIARRLGITERTVKFHLGSIYTKLGADNRAQAAALAVQRGLL